MTTLIPTVTLHDGVDLPMLGFGVFQVPPGQTEQVVADALAAGYRSLDTAAAYRNEEAVGRAIARSGIPREELFITTKCGSRAPASRTPSARSSRRFGGSASTTSTCT